MKSRIASLTARVRARFERWDYSRRRKSLLEDMTFSQAAAAFPDRNDLYAYMHHYFLHQCPQAVRDHRKYFSDRGRGFGEDAFHAMWFLLLREFSPVRCLEIGVYRGQVISLWALIGRLLNIRSEIHAMSPFEPVDDGVSVYPRDVDFLQDTQRNHAFFGLPMPTLVRALSTDQAALAHIDAHQWDLVYIDGSHDHDVVLGDYRRCAGRLASGGLLVLDDSSLFTTYRPPSFSFSGHPGPSRVVAEHAMKELRFIGGVGHNNVFRNQ